MAAWVGDQHQEPSCAGIDGITFDGLAVLDVGCGTGKDLTHPAYARAREKCGIDPSEDRIAYGENHYPELDLRMGIAEVLPYTDERFDFVVSRVALPYTQIQTALREIYRVMKPGGNLLLTMHDWRMEWRWICQTLKARSVKGLIRHSYVLAATAGFVLTGWVIPLPWGDGRECFQTRASLRRILSRTGFSDIKFDRQTRNWIVKATKS